jgi:hypothetical protein
VWDIYCEFSPFSFLTLRKNNTDQLVRSMLAVMTMNIGYFLSILGGTFLGSLAIGRFAATAGH